MSPLTSLPPLSEVAKQSINWLTQTFLGRVVTVLAVCLVGYALKDRISRLFFDIMAKCTGRGGNGFGGVVELNNVAENEEDIFGEVVKAWALMHADKWQEAVDAYAQTIITFDKENPAGKTPVQIATRMKKLREKKEEILEQLTNGALKGLEHIPADILKLRLDEASEAVVLSAKVSILVESFAEEQIRSEKKEDSFHIWLPAYYSVVNGGEVEHNSHLGNLLQGFDHFNIKAEGVGGIQQIVDGRVVPLNEYEVEVLGFGDMPAGLDPANLYHEFKIPSGSYRALLDFVGKEERMLAVIQQDLKEEYVVEDTPMGIKIERTHFFQYRFVLDDPADTRSQCAVFHLMKELQINEDRFEDGDYDFDSFTDNFEIFARFPLFATCEVDGVDKPFCTIEEMKRRFGEKGDFEEVLETLADMFGADVEIESGKVKDPISGDDVPLPFAFHVNTTSEPFKVFLGSLIGLRDDNARRDFLLNGNISADDLAKIQPFLNKIQFALDGLEEDELQGVFSQQIKQKRQNNSFGPLAKCYGLKVKESFESAFGALIRELAGNGRITEQLEQLGKVKTFKEADDIKVELYRMLVSELRFPASIWDDPKKDVDRAAIRAKLGTTQFAHNEKNAWSIYEKRNAATKRLETIFTYFENTQFYRLACQRDKHDKPDEDTGAIFRQSCAKLKTTISTKIPRADDNNNYFGIGRISDALDLLEELAYKADALPEDVRDNIRSYFAMNGAPGNDWGQCHDGVGGQLQHIAMVMDSRGGVEKHLHEEKRTLTEKGLNLRTNEKMWGGVQDNNWQNQRAAIINDVHFKPEIRGKISPILGLGLPRQAANGNNMVFMNKIMNHVIAYVKHNLRPYESLFLTRVNYYYQLLEDGDDLESLLKQMKLKDHEIKEAYFDVISLDWKREKIKQDIPMLVLNELINNGHLLKPGPAACSLPTQEEETQYRGFIEELHDRDLETYMCHVRHDADALNARAERRKREEEGRQRLRGQAVNPAPQRAPAQNDVRAEVPERIANFFGVDGRGAIRDATKLFPLGDDLPLVDPIA